MYYPYFRGKQYDLITVRENADLLAGSNFVPIIEPVKEALNGLTRAIDAVLAANGFVTLVVNPQNGDHVDKVSIVQMFNNELKGKSNVLAGILLTEIMTLDEIKNLSVSIQGHEIVLIHAGFTEGRLLGEYLESNSITCRHVFFEDYCGKLYRKHFSSSKMVRVLVRDGFQKRANRLHPAVEIFSDLHATYKEEGILADDWRFEP